MRFLADMGVSQAVVLRLREQGHEVWHLRERGLQRLPDPEIFRLAAEERRIVLTFDLDFSEIAAHSDGETSVVLFRLVNTRAANVGAKLDAVLGEHAADLERGSIVTVEDARVRVRRLPIGAE